MRRLCFIFAAVALLAVATFANPLAHPVLGPLLQRFHDDTVVVDFGSNAAHKLSKVFSSAVLDYAASSARTYSQKTAPFEWLPATVGHLMPGSSLTTSKSACFKSIEWSLDISADQSNYTVTADTSGHAGVACADFYLLSDRFHGAFNLYDVGRKHSYTKSLVDGELDDLNMHGLRVFYWQLGPVDTIESIVHTVELFMNVTGQQEQLNVDFFASKMQWALELREEQYQYTALSLQDTDIQSGDYFGILRLDGLDPFIAWGTGGHTGHTTMALWFEENGSRELYIVESTDSSGLPSLEYWPPPYGVIRTPFQQWVQQAIAAEYLVDITRLSPEFASKFNETAAQQHFYDLQGMPYGWHTFIFSFLDTATGNLPFPVSSDLVEIAFSFLDRLETNQEQMKGSTYNLVTQALNHQFNASCISFSCIMSVIDSHNMTLTEAAALPISDTWTFGPFSPPYQQCSNGPSDNCTYSFVCSSFVFDMYKAAGLFGSDTDSYQAVEQTPKDVYQMALFDAAWDRPAACKQADPALPYCQLLGKYVLTLPGWNTIPVYPHMNEQCSAVPPQYYRGPPGC